MENNVEDNTDDTSIRPVSSLRSHFESMLASRKDSSPTNGPSPVTPKQPSPKASFVADGQEASRSRPDGRFSLDVPRPMPRRESPAREGQLQAQRLWGRDNAIPAPRSRSSSKPRPISMGPMSPPRSPPAVTIESPRSPPKSMQHRPITPLALPDQEEKGRMSISRSASPFARDIRRQAPSRPESPATGTKHAPAPVFKPATAAPPSIDPDKATASPHVPPPVNRAGKPKAFSKPHTAPAPRQVSDSLQPNKVHESADERVSPFSTPPSSDPSSPEPEVTPPPIRNELKPRFQPTVPSHKEYSTSPSSQLPQSSKRRNEPLPPPSISSVVKQPAQRISARQVPVQVDLPARRPGLPPRHAATEEMAPELPIRRSVDAGLRIGSHLPGTSQFAPPPKRVPTMPTSTAELEEIRSRAPAPPLRQSTDLQRVIQEDRSRTWTTDDSDVDGTNGTNTPVEKHPPTTSLSDYPDSSRSNRRPPQFKHPPYDIPTRYDTKLFAICGDFACTSGYITRAWSVTTGEVLMSLSHDGETTKMTAMAFKPATDVEDEGKRIWLGSHMGELFEVDIPSQTIVNTRNAHGRREIIKIYRHASNMWTMDDDGKILVWSPDADGSPNLLVSPMSFNVQKGHTFSLLTGNKLWLATGKDIRVYLYDEKNGSLSQATQKPLAQPSVGEVTSGSTVSGQTDRIYFGHNDGKVTIYSLKDYACLGVVTVSLYKISTLVGVGDYLWAGYNTGKIYVYDTTTSPWTVKKDWHAHEDRIAGIVVDRTSLWKLDRLQVASLGTDNSLRIWDGMLQEDCLEADMHAHDVEFCDFREMEALVMTWNAGASKPTWLTREDSNFFRDLFISRKDPPDILVFGFQELVDLEKKSVTAKSLFKRNKKKDTLMDGSVQEHMSHQYRAWRDHLEQEIRVNIPHEPYVLLHTANLIGLFSCVFVKSSLRQNIRDVNAAEVKLGMGGLHGNKGALIVRFILDDSSVCFVNCHLAAGQTQTVHRNNDIAAIMEAVCLPSKVLNVAGNARSDLFVSGGDGSMILDHEICILNGDLNYRIDTMPRDAVISAVKSNNLAKLLERDQLLLSRRRNPGFRLRAFTESPITFAPTYKYDVGTDNYDSSEKKRSPAWCDRLLYKGVGSIKQLEYRRWEVHTSDHRPVSGTFKLRLKTVDPTRRKEAWKKAEERFEGVKRRIGMNTKLDYLINVLGCTQKEADRLLKK
ncbi:DNase I-like protein [Rhizodiscina lignyota]|uniref:DNase I-like protein n=1 Tax=Rhizodiscina lignyota TaxID=1504668 RepID=A0A9P4M415_9PEZI|nr:DNase I-like protein [Rhizodiscina lignyota]